METSEKNDAQVTLASLTPILTLDKLQVQHVARHYSYSSADPLPRFMTLHLLLADLLERLAFLKPSQRQTILAQYDQDIDENRQQWETLAFADGNWCTWTGHVGWLDLTTGEIVESLPAAPVETIGYNLVTLYTRAIAQIRKRNSDGKEHPAGSVDQS